MLTVTYALVTISVEQKKTRSLLSVLQQQVQRHAQESKPDDRGCFDSILYQLVQFNEACHWRNVERYVIPALRKVSTDADALIAELEDLSNKAENILRSVRGRTWQAFEQGVEGIGELYGSLELYCQNLYRRLAKEEEELLPIAQRVIPSEEWFDIAAQFISHDAEIHAHKSPAPSGAPRTLVANRAATHQDAHLYSVN
jgi:hemerythrin-like domain-containing protein